MSDRWMSVVAAGLCFSLLKQMSVTASPIFSVAASFIYVITSADATKVTWAVITPGFLNSVFSYQKIAEVHWKEVWDRRVMLHHQSHPLAFSLLGWVLVHLSQLSEPRPGSLWKSFQHLIVYLRGFAPEKNEINAGEHQLKGQMFIIKQISSTSVNVQLLLLYKQIFRFDFYSWYPQAVNFQFYELNVCPAWVTFL